MPTASDELRSVITQWFGGIEDYPVVKFLESHGFTLTRQWFWIKPVPSHHTSPIEYTCLQFLVDEWDYGGFVGDS